MIRRINLFSLCALDNVWMDSFFTALLLDFGERNELLWRNKRFWQKTGDKIIYSLARKQWWLNFYNICMYVCVKITSNGGCFNSLTSRNDYGCSQWTRNTNVTSDRNINHQKLCKIPCGQYLFRTRPLIVEQTRIKWGFL